jgi:hypothetical protein
MPPPQDEQATAFQQPAVSPGAVLALLCPAACLAITSSHAATPRPCNGRGAAKVHAWQQWAG